MRENYQRGKKTNLKGYASTTLDRKTAINFALGEDEPNPEKIPVLMKIKFRGKKQFFFLNSKDYSSYPDEMKILLQEGVEYLVTAIEVKREKKQGH